MRRPHQHKTTRNMGTESRFSSQRLKGKVVQSSTHDKYDNNDAQYTGNRRTKGTTKDWWVEGLRVLGICIVGGLVLSTALAIICGGLRGTVTTTTSFNCSWVRYTFLAHCWLRKGNSSNTGRQISSHWAE